MPKYDKLRRPCKECPLVKGCLAGWLGGDTPESFVDDIVHDATMPCHMTIDYSDPDWFEQQYPDSDLCVGALRFHVNWLHMPRDPDHAAAVRDQWSLVGDRPLTDYGQAFPEVFATPKEFVDYHRRRGGDSSDR